MTENEAKSISELQQDDEPKEPKPVVSENDLPPPPASSSKSLSTEGKEQEDLLQIINNDMSSADDDETYTLLCDMGYGLPREQKPRKEKLLAISRQLVNFIQWQMESLTEDENDIDKDRIHHHRHSPAPIQVVGCPDEETKLALQDRIQQNLASGLGDSSTTSSNNTRGIIPSHVTISCDTIEDICTTSWNHISSQDIVYLSPDASEKLEGRPPKIAIVGLLIDRRIQPNRSKNRATNLQITAKRWPIDDCFADINPNEPLNVDCVMEGMQQWWWNVQQQQKHLHQPNNEVVVEEEEFYRKAFIEAASQAIQHHAERHPSRPVHLPPK